jgi:hypothetical protein
MQSGSQRVDGATHPWGGDGTNPRLKQYKDGLLWR